MTPHSLPLRVYYEDTDAGGVVYYANYLKFAERARTEWLRELGLHQSQLTEEDGVFFMVRRCAIEYLAPARLDDAITVESHLKEWGKVRMTMQQSIVRGDKRLAEIEVEIVCVGMNGRPAPWPQKVTAAFEMNA
jgi:acyl-CoA thioester hydrolase